MFCDKNPEGQRQQLFMAIKRRRSVRRPFHPSVTNGPYKLPPGLQETLIGALRPFKNRDAAFTLAVLLGRFWSAPNRLTMSFPIDRRALSQKADFGLSEARIRGAIIVLETVGFIQRTDISGRTHQVSDDGSLHRNPILFSFGAQAVEAFQTANARSARAGRSSSLGRTATPVRPTISSSAAPTSTMPTVRYQSDCLSRSVPSNSPKRTILSKKGFVKGDLVSEPRLQELISPLEHALKRLNAVWLTNKAKPHNY